MGLDYSLITSAEEWEKGFTVARTGRTFVSTLFYIFCPSASFLKSCFSIPAFESNISNSNLVKAKKGRACRLCL
jgi:hypothetical protein